MTACSQLGKLKLHEEFTSVLLRLVDHSQATIVRVPATAYPMGRLRLPAYAAALPPKHLTAMQKPIKNKTYAQVCVLVVSTNKMCAASWSIWVALL